MKKRLIAGGAALCACVMLMNGFAAHAEEKRLGDYIYVPAVKVQPVSGMTALRVEGLALDGETGTPVLSEALSGAEFGVYVISGSGKVRPWANPLYPSEQMRIRTGEGETRFTLPQGAEYYLRQESAPQGYIFDSETLIPVTGEEIVVRNAMPGQLAIAAEDSLGEPLEGIELTMTAQDGTVSTVTTDEEGKAVLPISSAQLYTVTQSGLPLGVFAAQQADVDGQVQDNTAVLQVQGETARRTQIRYVHPAAGSVQLAMTLDVIDDNAQVQKLPLADVSMEISGAMLDKPVTIVTDSEGRAHASLIEGTYDVRLAYAGKEDAVLPLEYGQMIVSSGSTTYIDLSASQTTGRIVVFGRNERRIEGASVTLKEEKTGKTYGPYDMDAEGMTVSEPLRPGTYYISRLVIPGDMQLGTATDGSVREEDPYQLAIVLEAGKAAQAEIEFLTREQQTFMLVAERIDERGEKTEERLSGSLGFELIDAQGNTAAELKSDDGEIAVEALSGTYTLKMDARKAEKLGVQPASVVFELPSQEDVIVFASSSARLRVASVDENGEPVSGAQYMITDASGKRHETVTDADGIAVSAPVVPGEVMIETRVSPEGHDAAEAVAAVAMAGEVASVQMVHERYGTAMLSVRMKSLDAGGREQLTPMADVSITLYRIAEGGEGMTDTGLTLVTGEDGLAEMQLAPGEYAANAAASGLDKGCRAPQALRFTVCNTETISGELAFMDALGGVRAGMTGGELTDDQLAQVRFVLVAPDGSETELTMKDGAFYAGGLVSGTYVLRQTQIPQGFTLASERTVTVEGGEVTEIDVPLEEYAVLRVSKTGLTFDDALKTYVVPLSGEYGVYTMEDGEMKPYPSASAQKTVWANVTAQEIAQGKVDSLKLPASVDGTTYYLHEISGVKGFGEDENYYEIHLVAGENQTLSCAVSSDRGFFTLEQIDASTGMHLAGGSFELADAESGETVLAFDMGEEAYRNAMAIPVGEYMLRQTEAAPGYALSHDSGLAIAIEPYLTQGGTVTQASMMSAPIPASAELDLIRDVYAAREQGLTLLTVDTGALGAGETLLAPAAEIRVGAAGDERSNILSLVISGTGDYAGTPYLARVEYCLRGGGWQPSDARMTGELNGPTAISLADVQDDVSAVRVTYINALTGEEAVGGGFTPGQITLSVQASAVGDLNMKADAFVTGTYVYRRTADEAMQKLARAQRVETPFVMQAEGVFTSVCAGRDGKISGVAFFDEDADGVMEPQETGRYAGLTVSLLDRNGDVIDTCRTGSDGSYAFAALSAGEYTLQFDAGETVVFSSSSLFSAHVVSGVQDMRYGSTSVMPIDGDHTDYVVHAGCIYASGMQGVVLEQTAIDENTGFAGLSVEMRPVGATGEDEPFVTVTGGMGEFGFSRLLPGEYDVNIILPEGYLCDQAEDGAVQRRIMLMAGEMVDFGSLMVQKASSVRGRVLVDDDGDGTISGNPLALESVRVVLLRAEGGYTGEVMETVTGTDGAYAFEELPSGEYSVLFELNGQWAFTRYGADSAVYGAVSQSGSTRSFTLEPGQDVRELNAGVTIPAQLTVSVFKDTQYDGQKGTYEEMLEGVSISLIRVENGEDAEEVTYKTNEEGVAVFAGVSPGEYVIAYQMPGQWRATKQVDPSTTSYRVSAVPQSSLASGRSEPFMLTMGQSSAGMVIGAMLSGSISGVVYYDDNDDAQMDPTETACEGVKVELLNAAGEKVASAESGVDGFYTFEGLAPGRYRVRFYAKDGCGFSGTERSSARGGVLESSEPVSETRTISIANGTSNDSADAGIVRLGTMTGMIWEDRDADLQIGTEETGVSGVSVTLMNSAARVVITTATTDAEGRFVFERLRPGTYVLRVDPPKDHVFSGALSGSALPLESERGGRGYSSAFTLLGGADVQGVGFGVLTQGVISGQVWQDDSFDGYVNGKEEGLRGAVVVLNDAQGAAVRETTTIRSGEFLFDKVMPGEYTLSVTLPEGYVFTTDSGESIAPADADASATMFLGELKMGGTISDVRIGALKPASVSGVVWYDEDDDGRRQTDDKPVSGVRAVLEMTGGADNGKTFETTTDANGVYRFDSVMPGSAKITFILEDGYAFARNASATRRVSFVPMTDSLTASTAAIDVASGAEINYVDVGVVGVGTVSGRIWEDSQYDGREDDGESGVSSATVEIVDSMTGRVAASAQTDETGTYAIGFVRKGAYAVRVTLPEGMIFTRSGSGVIAGIDSNAGQTGAFTLAMGEGRQNLSAGAIHPAHMAGSVIVDANEDGDCTGETGFGGAVVTAMQGGTAIATVRTAEDGTYAFDMLRPGIYRLRFALDESALFAKQTSLKLAGADAQEGETGEYDLAMGQSQTVDVVPVVRAASIGGEAWLDEDVSGMKDAQETAMTGVHAELLDGNGSVIARAQVDQSGRYVFRRLRSGDYAVRFTLDDSMLFTDCLGVDGGSSVPEQSGNIGVTGLIALAQGEDRLNIHVGGILPGEIGDTVWHDKDGNGLQDYREPLIPGVQLTLYKVSADGQMTEAATTQSDDYGYYCFELLRPGTYVLRLDAHEGDTLTFSFGAPLGEIDSDLDPETGMSVPFKLASGQTLRNIDVGLIEHAE